jgi:c-di-GMP-binding flagellar brake protein YcgR
MQVGKSLDNLFKADILDISAGGIRFRHNIDDNKYNHDEKVYIQLYVYDKQTQLSFVLEAEILRVDNDLCAARFRNLENHIQSELDRIINESSERGLNDMISWSPGKSLFNMDNLSNK